MANGTTEKTGQLNLLKSILESMTVCSIVAIDLTGKILSWNAGAKRLYGHDAEKVLNKNFKNMFSSAIPTTQWQVILGEAKKNKIWSGAIKSINKNGEEFNTSLVICARCNAKDILEGFTLISSVENDFFPRSNLILKSADEVNTHDQALLATKKGFISNVSHELRTPLSVIIGYTQLLVNDMVDVKSPVYKEFIQNILSSSYHLLHLVNDILEIAKADSGKMQFNYEAIDFHKLLNEILATFNKRIEKKSLEVTLNIDTKINNIIADKEKLKKVFYNYISNSIKFTERQGKIFIRILFDKENKLRIEVEDTGIGIKEENIPKLFTEFGQLDSSISKKHQGTGLGLAVVKRIIELQGGQVGVESIFGKGSLFYAILPIIPSVKDN